MKKEEKNKLEIEKLKGEKNKLEFELSNINAAYFTLLAILVAIFVPAILVFNKWYIQLILLGAFLFFNYKAKNKFENKERAKKIKCLYCKIDSKYKELIK